MPWQIPIGIYPASEYIDDEKWKDYKYICLFNDLNKEGGYFWNGTECYKVIRDRFHDFKFDKHNALIRFRKLKDIKEYEIIKYVPKHMKKEPLKKVQLDEIPLEMYNQFLK